MPSSDARHRALAYVEAHFSETLDALHELVRIPGVSANPAPDAQLQRSAQAVLEWMQRIGLEQVEVLELPGVHPYVYGEWRHAPAGAPTVLLYAHHDVQPPGRESEWASPAFEPEERDGRLYGRGVADDKAGAAIHFAAIEAYLRGGGLPINVKVLIDGEEEIGSESLGSFLEIHRERLAADVLVITDTANLEAGLPSITNALRGLVIVDVTVSAVERPLHSGLWGGPVPDATLALCRILAGLVGPQGELTIEGLYDGIRPLTDKQRRGLTDLPYDEQAFRADAGLLEGVQLAGESERSAYDKSWHRPALTISAMEGAPFEGASNQIVPSARARIGMRTVPDMEARKVADLLCAHLTHEPPWGVRVETEVKALADGWIATPEGPAFEALERALEAGFGRPAAYIGCGGSIPFVEPLTDALGGVPALLIGLEDPICNAHSENESLLLSDFAKALRSAVCLYDELGQATGLAR